jgi:eukaryotic-like serine/threonine-protein kinase
MGCGMPESSHREWTSRSELAETAAYSAPKASSNHGVQFVLGTQPSLADETVALLGKRLQALCWVLILGLSLFLLRTLLLGDAPLVSVRIATLVVAVALVAYLRHPHSYALNRLRIVELVGLGVLALQTVTLQVAGMVAGARMGSGEKILGAMMTNFTAWGIIVMSYGFFIPNTWQRTARIVVPAVLTPLVTTILVCLARPDAAALTNWRSVVTCTIMTSIAGLAAVYGAYVVSAMRRESFAARRLGQYQLKQRLGGGGMGEVYLAEHALLKRPCAIKLIRTAHEADAMAIAQFEREVHATANLSHWNTVDIFDYGCTQDGAFYYVMEYLPGLSMQEIVLRYGKMNPSRVVYLLRQACHALAEAHAAGLVHRDIKPGNIFVAERGGQYDVVKLLDFGLVAQLTSGDVEHYHDSHAEPGTVSGTPLFMSPEQSKSKGQVDGRSDIYSIGATAYFILTGVPPFTASELQHILSAHQFAKLVPPQDVEPTLPEDLCEIVVQCLAKDPTDRFPSVEELEQALGACSCADQWGPREAAQWWARTIQSPTEGAKADDADLVSIELRSTGGSPLGLD